MDEERLAEETVDSIADEAEAKTLTSQVTDLIDDVRLLAHAEIEYYRAKLSVNMAATKRILTMFGVGLIFGTMAIIAFILGLLLILTDYLGPLAATGIVTGAALLVAAILTSKAIKGAKKLPLDEHDA
ncbi:MAG: phage holin family protein [Sphingomonadales bacterium]|nr:phage holin family protein [Sphingomonadales bacterium]NCO47984.1 phage holin family protein [Sphingomonadales bacterium]NCP01202.1 phage holin family protein [Sphingomonadales bacterium]NCP28202.1 phage holin family protein [Sphingomonadales bacterium]NCP42022.1 phage holin family protein [Sphingomonadales bacterium]